MAEEDDWQASAVMIGNPMRSFWDTGPDDAVHTNPGHQDTATVDPAAGVTIALDGFDEDQYIKANPDVAVAVLSGSVKSAREHFELWGRREGRDLSFGANDARDRLITTRAPSHVQVVRSHMHHSAEAVLVSRSGGVMLLGWMDDSNRPLDSIALVGPDWRLTFDAASLARRTRPDVAEALGRAAHYGYAYLGFVFGDREILTEGKCEVQFKLRDGGLITAVLDLRAVDDIEMRVVLLSHIAGGPGVGGVTTNGVACLARGLGDHVIRFNRSITTPITRSPYVERFRGAPRKYKGSIVVCLYGRPEYHFIQNALYSVCDGIEDYEFIYVSNSPELTDTLLPNARKAHRIYGLDQTLVLLPGNAGFGAANNVAVRHAQSSRILIVNPDVFPKDPDWARKHIELTEGRPKAQTRLFGAPLYYDDGSLMHGGMYFELDTRVSFDRNRTACSHLVRVEHYGKGAPADSPELTRARPVPAVTGAFISADRSWFEKLGGFTEDYVFGHYEDADLCLKSLKAGTAAWLHDLRLWHLEGKGSTRLPVHEGGSMVNRWLFSSNWGEMVNDGLLGPNPTYPLTKTPGTPLSNGADL
jgi:GT2 family glycosyltransferase